MPPRYIIFAPSYNDNSGGVIVLHKLCHTINELGGNAYLFPVFNQYTINRKSIKGIYLLIRNIIGSFFRKYKTNSIFNTPILNSNIVESDIVIYPEVVFGNPLKAKNIVRWLLHKPGFFTNEIFYGKNELYYKFDLGLVDDFTFYRSIVSNNLLHLVHIPQEIYNENNIAKKRIGTAYSIRKDKLKPRCYHPKDAILIDGLSHEKIAEIFKTVTTFISYDSYSAYSNFAVLCGCESIIVPEENLSEDEWYPDIKNRYGLAYGIDNLDFARKTRNLKLEYLSEIERLNTISVSCFIEETTVFFKKDRLDYDGKV